MHSVQFTGKQQLRSEREGVKVTNGLCNRARTGKLLAGENRKVTDDT